jgi:tetratricopeptide (TPR) repeat protein
MFDFRALINAALQALEHDRPAEAEKSIRAALAMNPRDDQLLHLLGVALIRQQREEDAIEPLQKAISLNRRDAEYHNALGCALRNVGRVGEGVESLQRAIKLEPGLQDAHFNLGQGYQRLGEFAKAEEKFLFVQRQNAGDVEVIAALSNLHWFLGDHERALQDLRAGIAANPGSGDIRFLLGEQLLTLGRYEEGWFQYLWRVNRHAFLQKVRLPFDSPQLLTPLPASLEGATLRVHAEQGIGDDLFFLRFVRYVRERGARVVGTITPRLLEMVGRSGALDHCEPAADRIPPTTDYRLLGDLPYLLEAHRLAIPRAVRFDPLPARIAEIDARLHGLARPLIGLTWRAGTGPETGNRNALFKEVPFGKFVTLAERLPGTLLVLQRQPKAGEVAALAAACGSRVVDFSALNADLEAMHALLARLDDYVGVSNTNVHLCAALGRSARVLVSRSVEFRWMASGPESPWFPGFPVYRQGEKGDWVQAMDGIVRDVARKVNVSI